MNTDRLLSQIGQVVPLNDEMTAFVESALVARPFKQGELIVKAGDTARYLMYVNAGYLMTYFTDEAGDSHVVQFAGAGWWAGDIYSLTQETHTRFSTKGLCAGEVLLLPKLAHNLLLEKYSLFDRYFRITFQHALIRQQLRFIESHATSAQERYTSFTKTYPTIEQYVPQKYIVSYLGITPEFLSKVRKNLPRA